MKKNEKSEKKSVKKKPETKSRTLFDHLTAIRTTKDPNYFESLSETEKKGFNHWSILHGLSMDINLTELVSFLWQDGYYDKIPSSQFYTVLYQLVPKSYNRLVWLKKLKKKNQTILKYISEYFSISTREAQEYLDIYMDTEQGMFDVVNILSGFGLTEKEIEKMLMEDKEVE